MMRCPKCDSETPGAINGDVQNYHCAYCGEKWQFPPYDPIDPAELLRLIGMIDYYEHDHQEVLDKVHAFLTGDSEPLKKLARGK